MAAAPEDAYGEPLTIPGSRGGPRPPCIRRLPQPPFYQFASQRSSMTSPTRLLPERLLRPTGNSPPVNLAQCFAQEKPARACAVEIFATFSLRRIARRIVAGTLTYWLRKVGNDHPEPESSTMTVVDSTQPSVEPVQNTALMSSVTGYQHKAGPQDALTIASVELVHFSLATLDNLFAHHLLLSRVPLVPGPIGNEMWYVANDYALAGSLVLLQVCLWRVFCPARGSSKLKADHRGTRGVPQPPPDHVEDNIDCYGVGNVGHPISGSKVPKLSTISFEPPICESFHNLIMDFLSDLGVLQGIRIREMCSR
ncbi:hypothetical protein IWZ01DRAFT_562024 [Phyllosticta capitalensis]